MPSRRRFMTGAAGLATVALNGFPRPALAQARPKIVIVGGGPGGLSVARHLADTRGKTFDITLVEPQATYTTCFYSNLYLGGFQALDVLQYGYDAVAAEPTITLARDRVVAINRFARRVTLAGGAVVHYDRLVLAPGIELDYDSVPGWSREAEERMPHAWKAGPQTELLKRQIDAVPDGGLVVMIAPPNPYRCPPGPYERVSMIAHALKSAGKTQARIVILDPKDKFSKQPLFQKGWERHYPGTIEWLPPMIHGGIKRVDPAGMTVETDFETYRNADLVNVIPRQTAGRVAIEAGLAGDDGFCPIDPYGMRSKNDPRVFVLGDAAIANDMPKSAYAANSQARAVAQVLTAELFGGDTRRGIYYRNRCWSLIGPDDSVFVGGEYQPTRDKILQTTSDISGLDDSAETRRANYEQSGNWYARLTAEMFG